MNRLICLAIASLIFLSPVYTDGGTSHDHAHSPEKKQTPTLKISVVSIEDKGATKLVTLKLSNISNDTPIKSSDLKVVHTEKVHLLIIDDSLEDYSHIHPKVASEPGIYTFEWAPKKTGNYRLWADLHPLSTDAQEYVITDLIADQNPSPIDKTISDEATVATYKFKLSFDQKELTAGKAIMGRISITDDKGKPFKALEPIMGAFAHIVGFGDDFKSIVHIHPMGEEPSKATDRGGPDLQFHLMPEKPGFIKLFVQVKIKGQELFVPFGISPTTPS